MSIKAYAAMAAKDELTPFEYTPEALQDDEVEVRVSHCGVCHSDIHLIDDDWGVNLFPLVAGHEVVGEVSAIGVGVTNMAVGDRVGIGWICGSCNKCERCATGDSNFCTSAQGTIIGRHGGYADKVRAKERFVFHIPEGLASDTTAPLMCAGTTVYTPLKSYDVKPWMRVGVIGIGGLGHLALQFYRAWGCEVIAFSTSEDKREEALSLGAHDFICTKDEAQLLKYQGNIDFILSTPYASFDVNPYFTMLGPRGKFCIVGAMGNVEVNTMNLLTGNKSLCGSENGNDETVREMLQFAERHQIGAKIQKMAFDQINEAIDIVRNDQAKYRIVLTNE